MLKKILTGGLAVAVTAGTLAVGVSGADAQPRKWKGDYGYGQNFKKNFNRKRDFRRHRGNDFNAAPLIFGTILGLGLSSALQPRYYGPSYYHPPVPTPSYYGGYGNAHVQWCSQRYRTYNPATNTYFVRVGVPAVCVSPFS